MAYKLQEKIDFCSHTFTLVIAPFVISYSVFIFSEMQFCLYCCYGTCMSGQHNHYPFIFSCYGFSVHVHFTGRYKIYNLIIGPTYSSCAAITTVSSAVTLAVRSQ